MKKYVGTWWRCACHNNGSSYDVGKLYNKPTKVVLQENGTGVMYWDMAKDSNFNWTVHNGKLSISGTALDFGINKSGYMVCQCAAMTNRMDIWWFTFFFSKE